MITDAEFTTGVLEICNLSDGVLVLMIYQPEDALLRMLSEPDDLDLRHDTVAMTHYLDQAEANQFRCLFCEQEFTDDADEMPAALAVLRPSIETAMAKNLTEMPVLVQGACSHCASQRPDLAMAVADVLRHQLIANVRLVHVTTAGHA